MRVLLIVLAVVVVLVLVLVMWVAGIYNKLVALRNRFKNAFAQIDVQLKRRHDLIPNLVETAKGYMAHERGTLEAVIQARNQASSARQAAAANPADADAMKGLMGAEGTLSGTLGKLFALVESYPNLKANENMMQLSEESHVDGEQGVVCAAGLQRLGDGIQHVSGVVSEHDFCGDVQFRAGADV